MCCYLCSKKADKLIATMSGVTVCEKCKTEYLPPASADPVPAPVVTAVPPEVKAKPKKTAKDYPNVRPVPNYSGFNMYLSNWFKGYCTWGCYGVQEAEHEQNSPFCAKCIKNGINVEPKNAVFGWFKQEGLIP